MLHRVLLVALTAMLPLATAGVSHADSLYTAVNTPQVQFVLSDWSPWSTITQSTVNSFTVNSPIVVDSLTSSIPNAPSLVDFNGAVNVNLSLSDAFGTLASVNGLSGSIDPLTLNPGDYYLSIYFESVSGGMFRYRRIVDFATIMPQASGLHYPVQAANLTATAVPTPEPGTIAMLGVGLAAMGVIARRRRRA